MKVGFGTQTLYGKQGVELCRYSYEVGYRIFDTALAYPNQAFIGKTLASIADRDEIQLISKVAKPDLARFSTRTCLKKILHALQTDYLDILLIHAPKDIQHEKILNDLLELQLEKKIMLFGLSNYTQKHLEYLATKNLKPQIIQVEIHPYLCENALIKYCHQHDIRVMAHSAFANGHVFSDTTLANLAKTLNCSIAQLVLAWSHARTTIPIISSNRHQHIFDNIQMFTQTLSQEIINTITSLNKNLRICQDRSWAEFDFEYTS